MFSYRLASIKIFPTSSKKIPKENFANYALTFVTLRIIKGKYENLKIFEFFEP